MVLNGDKAQQGIVDTRNHRKTKKKCLQQSPEKENIYLLIKKIAPLQVNVRRRYQHKGVLVTKSTFCLVNID